MPKEAIKQFFKHLIHNWGLKLVALLVAGGLWVYSSVTAERTRVFNIPVALLNIPAGSLVTQGAERTVPVRLRGSGLDLFDLDNDDFSARVDLQGRKLGTTIQVISPDDIELPESYDLSVDGVLSHRELAITLDLETVKPVPVRPHVIGSPTEGLIYVGASFQPPLVRLRGPAEALQQIDYVETQPVVIDGLAASGSFQVGLMPTAPGIEIVEGRLVQVNVELAAEETRGYQLPITIISPEGLTVRVEPPHAQLTLSAPSGVLGELARPQLIAYPPLSQPGEYEVSIHPQLPEGIYVHSLYPPTVTVTVSKP